MNADPENAYDHIRNGGSGYYQQQRGLIAVSGGEAVQFLDGLITNDVKTLGDGEQMLAAFPNAQGRLLAVVRVLRQGDRFLFEAEESTREKVFQNLFRFTFAGDFFVEDLSHKYRFFEIFVPNSKFQFPNSDSQLVFTAGPVPGVFVEGDAADEFKAGLEDAGAVAIDDELYETLRVENGIPLYGVDMGETTVVPELGIDGLISYNKGCYIGQEIIARIHFRGHVAKRLTGIVSDAPLVSGTELSVDGKGVGRITSVTFSPRLGKHIALAFVRYEHLAPGTVLRAGDHDVQVTELPFV